VDYWSEPQSGHMTFTDFQDTTASIAHTKMIKSSEISLLNNYSHKET
jgi:hypothetical protein